MNDIKLYNAIKNNDIKEVQKIVSNSQSLLNEEIMGKTWLGIAATENNIPILKFFLENGALINTENKKCDPPLYTATDKGSYEASAFLLENGADVNGRGDKAPPIACAISSGSPEIVKLLLDHGARVDITWGEFNYSPLRFARICGNREIVLLIGEALGCNEEMLDEIHRDYLESRTEVDEPASIEEHLEKYYGDVHPQTLTEIITDFPISINMVRNETKERIILCTSGLSKRAMNVPEGAEQFQHAELLFSLPLDWPMDEESLKKEIYRWPLDWMRTVVRHPVDNNTWIGASGVFSTEDMKPFAENTKLCAILAFQTAGEEGLFVKPDGTPIIFYTLFPLYKEELDIYNEKGIVELLNLFEDDNIDSRLDVERWNVGK